MKESYIRTNFRKDSLELIAKVNAVVTRYQAAGYMLTLRSLYYQMVHANIIPNSQKSYDSFGAMVDKAKKAGLIDWEAIEDLTRGLITVPSWKSGKDLLNTCASQYHQDLWVDQDIRLFCIIEKEALQGVFQPICAKWDIPLLPARGYISSTTLREFSKHRIMRSRQRVVVMHFGDHDPSGFDMSRDLKERIDLFTRGSNFEFKRMALNMEQIEQFDLPPNPAKTTDSRYEKYREEFGEESWELDALTPEYIDETISGEAEVYIDYDRWDPVVAEVERVKTQLKQLAEDFV